MEWCVGFYLSLCHGESFAKAYKAGMVNVKMKVGEAPPEVVCVEGEEGRRQWQSSISSPWKQWHLKGASS